MALMALVFACSIFRNNTASGDCWLYLQYGEFTNRHTQDCRAGGSLLNTFPNRSRLIEQEIIIIFDAIYVMNNMNDKTLVTFSSLKIGKRSRKTVFDLCPTY